MSKNFFIADLHLNTIELPRLTELFLSFLKYVKKQNADLYILGDLFDFWANNKVIYQKNKSIMDGLAMLGGVNLLWGNRDFLLRRKKLARLGITLCPEFFINDIQGYRILMNHGHSLCETKSIFLRYRRFLWGIIRLFDPVTPAVIENFVADKIRKNSKRNAVKITKPILYLKDDLLQKYFNQGIDVIICGHIHYGQIKEYPLNKRLIMLPAWDEKGGYCQLENGQFKMLNYTG